MLPDYAMIEPTTLCNLSCISCFRKDMISEGRVPLGSFSIKDLKNIHDKLPNLKHIRFHGLGELFLLPNNVEIIENLRNLYPKAWIELVTNGQYISTDPFNISKLIDRLTFSMSGGTKKSYETFHAGGIWEIINRNIKQFISLSSDFSLEINCVCTFDNCDEIRKLSDFCLGIGLKKIRVNIYQDWGDKYKQAVVVSEDKLKSLKSAIEYGKKFGIEVVLVGDPDFMVSKCKWMFERILIAYNGDILPCCMRPEHIFKIGNIYDDNIDVLWNGSKMKDLRNRRDSNKLEMCKRCPYIENVEILRRCS